MRKYLLVLLAFLALILGAVAPAVAATSTTCSRYVVMVSTGHAAVITLHTRDDVLTSVKYKTLLTHWRADRLTVSSAGQVRFSKGHSSTTPNDVPSGFIARPRVTFTGAWRVSLWDSTGKGYSTTATRC